MTQSNDYPNTGRDVLAKAFEELCKGDPRQASEKGWGAAAQMVKGVAVQRGWDHNGHAYLFQVISRLTEETEDSRLATHFHVANSLHTNFYETWLPEEMVRSGLDNVGELVEKLGQLSR